MDKVAKFKEIVNEMADLYEKKNDNYGDSFGKLYKELGPIAGLVPLHNKLQRATQLVQGGKSNFESLEDTFKDLACYAIMNLIALAEEKALAKIVQLKPNNMTLEYKPSPESIKCQISENMWEKVEKGANELLNTLKEELEQKKNSYGQLWNLLFQNTKQGE